MRPSVSLPASPPLLRRSMRHDLAPRVRTAKSRYRGRYMSPSKHTSRPSTRAGLPSAAPEGPASELRPGTGDTPAISAAGQRQVVQTVTRVYIHTDRRGASSTGFSTISGGSGTGHLNLWQQHRPQAIAQHSTSHSGGGWRMPRRAAVPGECARSMIRYVVKDVSILRAGTGRKACSGSSPFRGVKDVQIRWRQCGFRTSGESQSAPGRHGSRPIVRVRRLTPHYPDSGERPRPLLEVVRGVACQRSSRLDLRFGRPARGLRR